MVKRYDFVIVSQQSWDTTIGSNIKDIALELSQYYNVLFVNRPLDLKTWITSTKEDQPYVRKRLKARKANMSIDKINSNLFVLTPRTMLASINSLPDGKFFDFFNKRNNILISREIKRAISLLSFKKVVLINDGELFNGLYLPQLIKPFKSIYYYRDNFLAVPFWQKHGMRLEPKLFQAYDGITCNSEYLTDLAKKVNPNSFYVGQGCDFSAYQTSITSVNTSNKPTIGYVGALNSLRLNVELLEQLAAKNQQWNWVFVGPEDAKFVSSTLHNMTNVQFEGPKKVTELAMYLANFDVAINPQINNEVTVGNYPRKIDEYLYMGKPTVATATPAMQMFADFCYLAADIASYERQIHRALKENTKEKEQKRRVFALTHSWKNSVNAIINTIDQL